MSSILAQIWLAVLPPMAAALGALLFLAIDRAAKVARDRWGIEIEARHREALHSALMTGIMAALNRGLTGQSAVDAALSYARQSSPDALLHFDPSVEVLRSLAAAKLQEVVAVPEIGSVLRGSLGFQVAPRASEPATRAAVEPAGAR